jgi:hypothetical protein
VDSTIAQKEKERDVAQSGSASASGSGSAQPSGPKLTDAERKYQEVQAKRVGGLLHASYRIAYRSELI